MSNSAWKCQILNLPRMKSIFSCYFAMLLFQAQQKPIVRIGSLDNARLKYFIRILHKEGCRKPRTANQSAHPALCFCYSSSAIICFYCEKLQKPFRNDLAFVAACRRRRHHGLDLGQEFRPSSPGLKVMEPSSLSDEVSTLTFYWILCHDDLLNIVRTASKVLQMHLSLFCSF